MEENRNHKSRDFLSITIVFEKSYFTSDLLVYVHF